jgi:hypothetical protein
VVKAPPASAAEQVLDLLAAETGGLGLPGGDHSGLAL